MITDVQYREIEDIIGSVVAATSGKVEGKLMINDEYITGIHYLHGNYNEIRRRLVEKGEAGELKFRRYPLIALFQDIPIDKGLVGNKGKVVMQMIILYHTTPDRYNEDRLENVFKPVLIPIYQEFLKQLRDCGYFQILDVDSIKHRMIKRFHWGDPGVKGNTGYLFNDCLDGIELNNLELTLY